MESIYIVSTRYYAQRGMFKVGRTTQNMKVLREFKVDDSAFMEEHLRNTLKRLILTNGFYQCPYNLLEATIASIIERDRKITEAVNKVVSAVRSMNENTST